MSSILQYQPNSLRATSKDEIPDLESVNLFPCGPVGQSAEEIYIFKYPKAGFTPPRGNSPPPFLSMREERQRGGGYKSGC